MSEDVREYAVSEFRGSFPDVPIAAGVDMDALRAQDDPMFLTLPIIPKVGATSRNGLLYDDALAASIVAQINEKRPDGIWGHLKEEERSTAFPEPAATWIGAIRDGDTVWAKAILSGPAKERIRRLKATGGQIATSIYGKGDFEPVSQGVRRLKNFDLESLDFAPPARAALRNGSQPNVTAELEQETVDMDRNQIIAELTVGDLPAALRDQIVAPVSATVAELRQAVSDRDVLVSELQTTVAEYRRREFGTAVKAKVAALTNWPVTEATAVAKLEAFRRTLESRIVTELAGDASKLETVAETVWADLQPLAETVRDALAGPAAIVTSKVSSKRPTLEDTPEARAKARAEFAF